ncbi:MAG: hypothetical protein IJZ96_06340, partial [Lachnospiraceae bacterium]|nr:hypothetical protein [Lachnospiraceae bacterium]
MQIVKDIYVPMDAEGPFEHIKAQQNSADSLRVRICLLVNNQLFTLPTGIIPQIVYSKPDGHLVVNDCAVDGNYIIVDYTKQMLIA